MFGSPSLFASFLDVTTLLVVFSTAPERALASSFEVSRSHTTTRYSQ